jgi:ABC-type transport system substrate-binding protein
MKCLGLASSFLSLFLALTFVEGAESPRYGGRLVFGLSRDISGLNPFFRTRSTNKYVRQIAYETLLDYDENEQLVPALAESWSVSSDSRLYTIRLRRGVKFHNGEDLTAEDVKWSAEYAMDPKNAATGVAFLERVQAVNVKDRFTVEFVLKEPRAIFLNLLANVEASFPVLPKGSVAPAQRDLPTPPPGTGPFEFKEYKTAREMVFVRNKNYWQKGVPYLDELVIKPVEDEQVRFAALRAGDLNMIERTPYAFIKKIRNGEFPEIKLTEAKDAGFRRLIFNVVAISCLVLAKEFDRLMAEAAKIQDQKRRYELYSKALRIINEDIPDISLAFVPRYFTYQEKVRGFRTSGEGRLNMVGAGVSRAWIAP